MYKVYFVTCGYYSSRQGNTLDDAQRIAKAAGFQARIEGPDGNVVATWCPDGGLKLWDRSYAA